jgi:hypothetical protein
MTVSGASSSLTRASMMSAQHSKRPMLSAALKVGFVGKGLNLAALTYMKVWIAHHRAQAIIVGADEGHAGAPQGLN